MGRDDALLVPLKYEESIVEHAALPFTSASLELLLAGVDTLLKRAYARPRMGGRYAGGAYLECVLYQAHSWEKQVNFKQPVGDWQRASRIIRGQLGADHPRGLVEEVTLSLCNITGESGVQLGLLPDARRDREGRLAEAERQLQARTGGRPALYRVVAIAPWHPAPEMRVVQVPIDPSGAGGMKPLSTASPATVREGTDRQPAAVRLGERWHRVAPHRGPVVLRPVVDAPAHDQDLLPGGPGGRRGGDPVPGPTGGPLVPPGRLEVGGFPCQQRTSNSTPRASTPLERGPPTSTSCCPKPWSTGIRSWP